MAVKNWMHKKGPTQNHIANFSMNERNRRSLQIFCCSSPICVCLYWPRDRSEWTATAFVHIDATPACSCLTSDFLTSPDFATAVKRTREYSCDVTNFNIIINETFPSPYNFSCGNRLFAVCATHQCIIDVIQSRIDSTNMVLPIELCTMASVSECDAIYYPIENGMRIEYCECEWRVCLQQQQQQRIKYYLYRSHPIVIRYDTPVK